VPELVKSTFSHVRSLSAQQGAQPRGCWLIRTVGFTSPSPGPFYLLSRTETNATESPAGRKCRGPQRWWSALQARPPSPPGRRKRISFCARSKHPFPSPRGEGGEAPTLSPVAERRVRGHLRAFSANVLFLSPTLRGKRASQRPSAGSCMFEGMMDVRSAKLRLPLLSKTRAVGGNAARRDLRGGGSEMTAPTATLTPCSAPLQGTGLTPLFPL